MVDVYDEILVCPFTEAFRRIRQVRNQTLETEATPEPQR